MEINLTKDAQKLEALIYKEYLSRRKAGMSKSTAKEFEDDFFNEISDLMPYDDAIESFQELKTAFPIKDYIDGSFDLSNEIIVHMENRFINGAKDVLSFLSQFIP